jgi:hypothetical protein
MADKIVNGVTARRTSEKSNEIPCRYWQFVTSCGRML